MEMMTILFTYKQCVWTGKFIIQFIVLKNTYSSFSYLHEILDNPSVPIHARLRKKNFPAYSSSNIPVNKPEAYL